MARVVKRISIWCLPLYGLLACRSVAPDLYAADLFPTLPIARQLQDVFLPVDLRAPVANLSGTAPAVVGQRDYDGAVIVSVSPPIASPPVRIIRRPVPIRYVVPAYQSGAMCSPGSS